jgi:hypothetical protein
MRQVPKLSLANVKRRPSVALSDSKRCDSDSAPRSLSLEASSLFQPHTLKSLAEERVIFKSGRLVHSDRTDICEGKLLAVASEWNSYRAGCRRSKIAAAPRHWTISPRTLSTEREESSQRLLDLAEATCSTLQKLVFSPQSVLEVPEVSSPTSPKRPSKPFLKPSTKPATLKPRGYLGNHRSGRSLLSRLQTPVLANRKQL